MGPTNEAVQGQGLLGASSAPHRPGCLGSASVGESGQGCALGDALRELGAVRNQPDVGLAKVGWVQIAPSLFGDESGDELVAVFREAAHLEAAQKKLMVCGEDRVGVRKGHKVVYGERVQRGGFSGARGLYRCPRGVRGGSRRAEEQF